jgi:uncharacterized surface protein with fasciclin (FAS1) repeats
MRGFIMKRLMLITILLLLSAGFNVFAQEQVMDEPTGYLRVAHFAPDGEEMDVYVDGVSGDFQTLAYQDVSDWVALPAGEVTVSVAPAGSLAEGALLEPVAVSILDGTWTTAVVSGSVADDTVNIQPIPEAYMELIPGTAGFTVIHMAEDGPTLNLIRDDIAYVTDLNYVDAPQDEVSVTSFRIDGGLFDMEFVEPETPDTVVIDLPQTEIPENTYMLIAIVGTGADVEAVTHITDASDVALVTHQLEMPGTILEAAEGNENLTELATTLEATGLADQLSSDGPFTLFAPANFVLQSIDTTDPQATANLLLNHVVEGKLTSQDVFNATSLTTMGGTPLQITRDGNNVFVNGAQIIDVNIPATNGVIHMLSGVIEAGG